MKNEFLKGLIGVFIKSFIVILIVCGWWVYDVESNNKFILGWEKLKHQTLPNLSLNKVPAVKETGSVKVSQTNSMAEKQQESLRLGGLYQKLKIVDEQDDYLLLNKALYEGFMEGGNGANIHSFLQAFRFSEDKVNKLHEQEKVDPRYYLQHANLSWNYATLLKEKQITSSNMAEPYNKIMDSTVRYFQSYLLTQEDIVRCVNAEYAQQEFDDEKVKNKVERYNNALEEHGDLLRNSARNLSINLSDSTAHRMPNVYLCKENDAEPELISDEEWQIKRAEVRKKFLEKSFSKN